MLFENILDNIESIVENWDSKNILQKYDDNFFDLVITSPPYNIWKSYETKIAIEDYLSTQEDIIKELVRVTSDKWSICWQVGNFVDKWEVFPLDIFYYNIFKKYWMKLRNRIIWHFWHWLHASKRFSWRYETILWFTKSDDYIFNLDDVRVPSKYPWKLHFKWDKKWKPSWNPLWKNPSDIWEIVVRDWENELWNIPNVKSNHPEKTGHPCQYPVELVERCVLALTNSESWVLDPFNWAWSTMIASLKNNRHSVWIDRDISYCKIAKEKIESLRKWQLKTRPINQPIHKPKPWDKLSKIPDEWIK